MKTIIWCHCLDNYIAIQKMAMTMLNEKGRFKITSLVFIAVLMHIDRKGAQKFSII